MEYNLNNILEMKGHINSFGIDVYDWFFNDLENNYLSKLNGTERNAFILQNYERTAQEYIIHQLYYVNSDAANSLMKELEIFEPFVSDENLKHINKNIQ